MKIVKCENTGNVMVLLKEVEEIDDKVVKANSTDAAFEKHVPQFEEIDNKVKVYVDHVMEEDHYIEWIMIDYGNMQIIKEFKPGEIPEVIVETGDNIKAYAYCNKHSLWENKKGE